MTYVYAGSIRVASLTTQATTTGTESNTFYYHGDHLGSSSIITDGSGTVVRNISYQPWGNVHTNTEESGANTPDPNHKFTGQILDDSTDLYYYGARYYDPQLRRFITPDTIVQAPYDPQSLNRYAYCRNNPLGYTDPSGHFFLEVMGFAAFMNVAFHKTDGDIHNWNDAFRYAYQGAAWGAGIAGVAAGIGYLNPVVNLNVGYGGVTLAGVSVSNSGSQFYSPFGSTGEGPTGSINIAQLSTPNWPMYAEAGVADTGYKKPAETMDLFAAFYEGAIGEQAISATNQLLRRNKTISSATKSFYGVNKYSAYAITKGTVSSLPRYTGALTVSLFIFDADQILSNPDLNNTQKTSLTIGKASTSLLSWSAGLSMGKAGAAYGSSFGPWGTVIGGVGGAVTGGVILPWIGDKLIEKANE